MNVRIPEKTWILKRDTHRTAILFPAWIRDAHEESRQKGFVDWSAKECRREFRDN